MGHILFIFALEDYLAFAQWSINLKFCKHPLYLVFLNQNFSLFFFNIWEILCLFHCCRRVLTHCILFIILPENLIFILISKCVFGISILLLNNLTSRIFELQVYSGEGQLILLFSNGNYLTWCVLSHFSHVQLCDPMDSSQPCSSVAGISQARILE